MKPRPLSTLATLLELQHSSDKVVSGAAIDSRLLKRSDLYFALPGNRVDGHDFLEAVAAKGASGAVVREDYRGESFGLPLLHVPDVLLALQELGRKLVKSKVIAITGSLGKTTAKGFIKTLLEHKYHVFASPLSYNSQATVPLSILMADEIEDYLILEMGMTHPGDLAKLVNIAPPHIALLTTVALQHAVNFPDGLAGIAREKASIFSHPDTELGILPKELHHFEEVYHTGTCEKRVFEPLEKMPIELPMKVHEHNFSAAAEVALAVGMSWEEICQAAQHIALPPMRFEKVEYRGITFINDAYNANPDAMKAALESLPEPKKGGKRIAVLSEMNALGMYAEAGHALVAEAALEHADLLLCLGERCETMRKIWKEHKRPVELFETRDALEKMLHAQVKSGDVVLLKGARACGLDEILLSFM